MPDGGWCRLPGAWVHDDAGYHDVTSLDGGSITELRWLTLPMGFCAHSFATVGNVRQIRFAPGGELFAASPTMGTTSGGQQGMGALVVLPDDDRDGWADTVMSYRAGLPATQGLLFHNGGLYYQDLTRILREPYVVGQRSPSGASVQVADITVYVDTGHWPKTLDADENGLIYVTNGGFQGDACDPSMPFHGGILSLDGSDGGHPVAKGLRNPIYLRCHHDGHNRCFANELAKDYSSATGGREKLIPVREGDNWGYPCCATKDLPYTDECLPCSSQTEVLSASTATCMAQSKCSPKCDQVVGEEASFIIGDTPFGLDFIDGQFPPPWDHRVYIAAHGAFGTWVGARVVGVAFDPSTGVPLIGTNLPGQDAGAMVDFLEGWDDGTRMHGRPADVTVSPDGRLFVANDTTGEILWVAPLAP
jgi:glucose/arabinose dehydrogenase